MASKLVSPRTLIAVAILLVCAGFLVFGPWSGAGGGAGIFTDVTAAAGVVFRHENGMPTPDGGGHRYVETVGGGLALFDYDGDGWLDIYLVNGNRFDRPDPGITNKLYRNNRDGTFTDVTAAAGVGDPGFGQGATAADYDNDGDVDLYVTNLGPDRFYRNDGNGKFTEVAAQVGIRNDAFGQTCAFFDYDGDGDLDLYVQNYVTYVEEPPRADYATPLAFAGAADLLFRNDGNGKFTEVGKTAGIHRPDGRGMGAVCVDLDGDRDPDMFVANDGMENYYFENDGNGKFTEQSIRSGLAYDHQGNSESSMGADVGDIDGDGKLDIVCPALRAEGCTLYRNRGDGFEDISRAARLAPMTQALTGFSPNLIDVDNDGDLDLFLCNGGVARNLGVAATASYLERYGVRDLLARNDGKGGFDDASAVAGPHFRRALIGRGSAAGDLDNDGDIDLVINNLAGPAVILRNDGPQGHWITLRLVMKNGNRDAINTLIRLTAGGRTQTAIVRAAGSYLSINDRRPHFGLAAATRVERIEITWPDGQQQTVTDVAADQFLTIEQSRE